MTLGTSRSASGTFSGSSSGGSEGGWDRDVPSVKGAIFKGCRVWPQHERERVRCACVNLRCEEKKERLGVLVSEEEEAASEWFPIVQRIQSRTSCSRGRSGPGAPGPHAHKQHAHTQIPKRGSPSDLTRRETTPPVGVAELATPRDAAVAEQTHNSVSERVAEIKSKKRSCTGSPSGPPSFTTSAYHDFVASGWGPMTPTFPSPNGTTIAAASPLV